MTAIPARADALRALAESPFDLLVVGGGIVGAGVARDAAMRGFKTALVEQHDFASGTSSRSSRLLHGGLRYLAQGRIGLVREASLEKRVIHEIAPHLAQPLPFLFPAYHGNRHWVLWQLKLGVKLYDALCGGRNFGASTWLSRSEALQEIPGLAQAGLEGAVRYHDGFTNDSRLTLDTLRSAARAGATLANYCRFHQAASGGRWECDLEDQLESRMLQVRARAIVNAAGPWADGLPHSRVKLRLTKGIHLVLDRVRFPVSEAVVMTAGKRILFAIPWGDRVILGTTDTDYPGPLEQISIQAQDIAAVLEVANRFFPQAGLVESDALSSWAGVRPLIANPNGNPSEISRSHDIRNPEPGWWDVAGGKLTTYRLMAEQTLDRIVNSGQLGRRGRACQTAKEPLLPPNETAGVSGILPPSLTRQVVEHYCAREWAIHLDDVMLRRSGWHHYLDNAETAARQVADWMGESLGWPAAARDAELARYWKVTGGARAPRNLSGSDLPRKGDSFDFDQ